MSKETVLFEEAVLKSREWMSELAKLLDSDPHTAYQAFRSVMHALRDILGPVESAKLASELPLLLRGVFYEGWRPGQDAVPSHRLDDFLEQVERGFQGNASHRPNFLAEQVFTQLAIRISDGQIARIRSVLPHGIRELWPAISNSFGSL